MSQSVTTRVPGTVYSDNVCAWILCAPACVALTALNLLPAARALLDGPPLPLTDELTNWGYAMLAVGGRAVATTGVILAIEIPIAVCIAITIIRRSKQESDRPITTPAWILAAMVAGFSWRLVFGSGIGFIRPGAPGWPSYALEVWRSLPLAVLLFYVSLCRAGAHLAHFAKLDGAGLMQTVRLLYLPICAPAAFLLAVLRIVDYLRALDSGILSSGAGERAVWTLLLLTVGSLALRLGERPEPTE